MDGTEERNSELEDRIIEGIQSEKQRKINWKKKSEQSLKNMWVYSEICSVHVIDYQEERRMRVGLKKYSKG